MEILDILEETYSALSANKARSSLTILGIVIGISSVIAMLAIGQGAQNSVQSSIASIGSNILTVRPGVQRGPGMGGVSGGQGSAKSLKNSDAEALKSIENVQAVSPEVSSRSQVTAKGLNTNTTIYGVTEDYATIKSVETTEGNFITGQHQTAGSRVAVLGPTARDDLFGVDATEVVGQTIRINSINFTVIGIAKAKGGSGFGNQDDMIYIPLSTNQRLISKNEYLSTIEVAVTDTESMTGVQEAITELLMQRHKITDATKADFNIMNMADMAAAASSIASIFTILLGSVAGISLVVGGIGIMNMMLTNVTERTREIGLRKAIGAKGKDIGLQFLIEAIALTFIGGLIGVIAGCMIGWGLAYFGVIQTKVSLFSVLLAFGVSAIIGIVFGYWPARRASKLNPIEALRFE